MLLSNADAIAQFITAALIFVFVCALTYFTSRFIGGYQKSKMQGANIHIVETTRVAQNKYLQIVEIGNRLFLVSVCKDSMSFIAELNKEDVVLPDKNATPSLSFKDILEKARNKKPKK